MKGYVLREYSSCFMHAIVARMRLPFKIFSNFVYFCPNFLIFCPFLPFFCPFFALYYTLFLKIARMRLLSGIGPGSIVIQKLEPKVSVSVSALTLAVPFPDEERKVISHSLLVPQKFYEDNKCLRKTL